MYIDIQIITKGKYFYSQSINLFSLFQDFSHYSWFPFLQSYAPWTPFWLIDACVTFSECQWGQNNILLRLELFGAQKQIKCQIAVLTLTCSSLK